MPNIHNVHVRRFDASPDRVAALIGHTWSGGSLDAFPHDWIRPVRTDPPGADGFVAGQSRFGHGPFRFTVERWDGRVFVARIDGGVADGTHGFELTDDAGGTLVTHTLAARFALRPWLVWRAVTGRVHDWAVESMFDRLDVALRRGMVPSRTPVAPPWQLRAFDAVRRRRRSAR